MCLRIYAIYLLAILNKSIVFDHKYEMINLTFMALIINEIEHINNILK